MRAFFNFCIDPVYNSKNDKHTSEALAYDTVDLSVEQTGALSQ